MMEEANLGAPPEERTEMPALYETLPKFEYQNKLRPGKGKPDMVSKKDGSNIIATKPQNGTDLKVNTDRSKEKNGAKDDSRKDAKAPKEKGSGLAPPPDTMEKSFKEDGGKKVVVQPLDDSKRPLLTRKDAPIEKKMVVTEYMNSPQKKKLLKKVNYIHIRRKRRLQRRNSLMNRRKY